MKNFLQKKKPQIIFAQVVAIYFLTQLIFRS